MNKHNPSTFEIWLKEENIKVEEIIKPFGKIQRFFDSNIEKTIIWFHTLNQNFGNISPLEMVRSGKLDKLNKFIDQSLEESHVS